MPSDKHYPDVDTDAPKKEQAADATAQFFGTLRGRIGVLVGHLGLVASPVLAYQELTAPEQECTASEMVCAFTPGSLGLPLIAIMASCCAMIVGVYWMVRMRD